ncbi:V-type immunoglobulin domain-containing suppressor of T-cell activation [Esox lucius]|uniref:V-type immunoglobulin domain-containing suppressor of T-cell activation n=1 Tax=Esox lucius TaxID=8010 RepID=UPI00057812E3|nr:V-type immunoglobulin domain-containing suppressor of T-cell activation [Esox lucius]
MTWELFRSETLPTNLLFSFLICFQLVTVVEANVAHAHTPLTVSAPHLSYICHEGANVTLLCSQKGAKQYPSDSLHHSWLFTPHLTEHCHERVHPRGHRHPGNHSHTAIPWGVRYGGNDESFWVQLQSVSPSDQGRYCCLTLDVPSKKTHSSILQIHSHVFLTVMPVGKQGEAKCTVLDIKPTEGSVAAGLATAACIMAILSLPLILVLVYKQRQSTESSRRAHELVRMDSEAAGHENPVFLGGPTQGQGKTRTVSQIMTRQSSETGRHLLLSDPGTPLSPPVHGDVFFPAHEPIPESPDFLQV